MMKLDANEYYLNEYLKKQEEDDRHQERIDDEVAAITQERITTCKSNDLHDLITELDVEKTFANELFEDLNAKTHIFFTDESDDNARELGVAFSAFIRHQAMTEEYMHHPDS